jgi:hypothetical protein
MKKLDINLLDLVAKEYSGNENMTEVYVVRRNAEGMYDDPMTCLVDIADGTVHEPQPFHQFWKFRLPVELKIDDSDKLLVMKQFLTYSVKAQKRLISLYDLEVLTRAESITIEDAFQYVKRGILLPLSEQEFNYIENGFRLRWNYSSGQMIGDRDMKRAVSQYLVSIDYHMDQRKMKKVVDLILEYLEWIGQWG